MSGLLADIQSIITSLMTTISSLVTMIIGQPLLLIPTAFAFLGAGIAFFKKVKHN